jgi:hypothetical protein
MKLDGWMQQDHTLDENLGVIESLSQAVNEVHDRGDAFGGLQPDRIDVDPEGRCDPSEAKGASPSPGYAPPDGEGDSASDVYAVGRIAWEILAGRPAGDSPRHLSEVRPDISKELADAIMACLEESADWRPKDLTFLAQMAAVRQKGTARSPQRARGTTRTARRTPSRTRGGRRQGGRTWPLLAAFVVVLGLAVFAWRQFAPEGFPGAGTTSEPQTPPPTATPPPAPPVTETAPRTNTPAPGAETPAGPAATEPAADQAVTPAATPEPEPVPEPARQPEPPAPPPPSTRPATETALPPAQTTPPQQAPPPVRTTPAQQAPPPAPSAPPRQAPSSAPAASTEPVTPPPAASVPSRPAPPPETNAPIEETAPAAPAPPATPATLTAVSPLEVKRPGKVLIDLRGQGFLDQHSVRILPLKKAPRGISVVRHKRANDGLITVLIDLTEEADPGEYAIALEDAAGNRTAPLTFTVTK